MPVLSNYQRQAQILTHWCWAAVASSIASCYDRDTLFTQSKLGGDLIDSSCAAVQPGQPGGAPAVCNNDFSLSQALNYTQNFAWQEERYLTLQEITDQINGGWPICCQIYWTDRNDQAHYIVIYGYENDVLTIADPAPGVNVPPMVYDDLINQGYNGGRWIRTFGTQPV